MYNTHKHTNKNYPRHQLPSQVYPEASVSLQKIIFSEISSVGGGLEQKTTKTSTAVPRQSNRIVLKNDMDTILSRINSIKVLIKDKYGNYILDLQGTIEARKSCYDRAPYKIIVRGVEKDLTYTKHFDTKSGVVSYRLKE